jgi:uncharacterized protein YndB with AHSA1/START domain
MPEIVVDVVIKAPAMTVFHFATTPRNWPRFWPVTLAVSGDVNVSPPVGATWSERVKIWLWTGDFHWKTVATSPPTLFEIECTKKKGFGLLGRVAGRTTGRIRYSLTEQDGQTTFHRVLNYEESRLVGKVIDFLITRWFLTMVARRALSTLARILDQTQPMGGGR